MQLPFYFRDDSFKSYCLRSLTIHFGLVVFVFLFGKMLHLPIPFLDDSKNVTIVESVVRVDLVAMPKMTLKELKAVDMSEVQFAKENVEAQTEQDKSDQGKEANQEDPNAPTFNQDKKKNFENLLKEWSKKKTKVKGGDTESTFTSKLKGKFAQLVAEGNKISRGSALVGQTEGEATEFTLYISSLPDSVRPYWRLPSYLKGQGLRCRVRIYLSETGDLVKASLFESSGNNEYDQRAIEAVKRSAPFPAVPQSILTRATKGEIVLGFPL